MHNASAGPGLLGVLALAFGSFGSPGGWALGLGISAWTHYTADRREYGLMFKLARLIPGKADFLRLGAPRAGLSVNAYEAVTGSAGGAALDNPTLGTGAWALDQSWHIFWGVFVAGLVIALV